MTGFIVIGTVAALAGLALVVIAIRRYGERNPRHVAMLIGGMMLTAFGIVLAGFAIAWERTPPLALNAAAPTP